ncbi:MAG: hypothetical protein AAF547_20270 [Actinomycetota bacterium]
MPTVAAAIKPPDPSTGLFPRVEPAVFASIRGAYASAESVEFVPELPEADLLALVLLPALNEMGSRFEALPLRAPGRPNIRRLVLEYLPGRVLLLSGRMGSDGRVTVEAAELTVL